MPPVTLDGGIAWCCDDGVLRWEIRLSRLTLDNMCSLQVDRHLRASCLAPVWCHHLSALFNGWLEFLVFTRSHGRLLLSVEVDTWQMMTWHTVYRPSIFCDSDTLAHFTWSTPTSNLWQTANRQQYFFIYNYFKLALTFSTHDRPLMLSSYGVQWKYSN